MAWTISAAMLAAYENCTCLPALVAASLAECFSGIDASAPSRSTPTVDLYWWPDKTTGHSRLSRFGTTSEPLTADRGAELLTWWLAASPVRTSALPAKATDSTASVADSGWKWPASYARYDPDSCTWKTRQHSLLGGLTVYSGALPRWGSMRSGELLARQMWEPTTNESEYGFWQTPVADDAVERVAGKWNSRGEPKLSAQVKLMPTPTAMDARPRVGGELYTTKNGTIRARNADGTSSNRGLAAMVMYPTPTAQDAKNNGASSQHDRNTKPLNAEIGGALNPPWVEWLMGWPIGWTDLKPLETARFREWLQQHGGS